jgi:hypothetical protein
VNGRTPCLRKPHEWENPVQVLFGEEELSGTLSQVSDLIRLVVHDCGRMVVRVGGGAVRLLRRTGCLSSRTDPAPT